MVLKCLDFLRKSKAGESYKYAFPHEKGFAFLFRNEVLNYFRKLSRNLSYINGAGTSGPV